MPAEDQVGELKKLQDEGKIRHIGLSEVTVEQVEEARKIATIATVQNLFNLANRDAEPLLDYCEQDDIGFIPWFPLATGELSQEDGPLAESAQEARRDAVAARAGVAAAALAGDAADPRHLERRPPRVEHRRGRASSSPTRSSRRSPRRSEMTTTDGRRP